MDRIVVIGARSGSKRVPNKNIRLIGDIPLIAYTLEKADKLQYPTYVSSESDEILDIVEFYSSAHTIKRPAELASDTATDIDWIKHLLIQSIDEKRGSFPEQVILLRPTTPLRCVRTLLRAINEFDSTKFTSLRSVEEMSESCYKKFKINNGILEGFSNEYKDLPNQSVPHTYTGNGYIDILLTTQIMEEDDMYGNKIQPFITENTVEIDTENDLNYMDYLIKEQNGPLLRKSCH